MLTILVADILQINLQDEIWIALPTQLIKDMYMVEII